MANAVAVSDKQTVKARGRFRDSEFSLEATDKADSE